MPGTRCMRRFASQTCSRQAQHMPLAGADWLRMGPYELLPVHP